jgi:hypothetical protein
VSDDTRDRVIRLETTVDHLSKQLEDTHAKVSEMHGLLLQAKGAKWVIMGGAAVAGFLSAKFAAFIPWLSLPPR